MGETPLSDEQAEEEYAKAEKGLRFQLIEGKVMAENNLQITFGQFSSYFINIITDTLNNRGP